MWVPQSRLGFLIRGKCVKVSVCPVFKMPTDSAANSLITRTHSSMAGGYLRLGFGKLSGDSMF